MKKSICSLVGLVMLSSTAVAEVKIPEGFEGYRNIDNMVMSGMT